MDNFKNNNNEEIAKIEKHYKAITEREAIELLENAGFDVFYIPMANIRGLDLDVYSAVERLGLK